MEEKNDSKRLWIKTKRGEQRKKRKIDKRIIIWKRKRKEKNNWDKYKENERKLKNWMNKKEKLKEK